MENVISTAITALATVTCAVLAAITARNERAFKANSAKIDSNAKKRAEEGKLQLQMIHANSKLTIGVAMALKNGHCNGEVEDGLAAVQDAETAYTAFLENMALEALRGK